LLASNREELLLAIEALAALVDDAYPALPLADLARHLDTYGPSGLSADHYEALANVERSVLDGPESLVGAGNDSLQDADVSQH
jgi:hypothetical protein